jgi:hypothetical protein
MTIHPHGDYLRYKYNRCRCAECRAANAAQQARRRRLEAYGRWIGAIPAIATQRRLQAAACNGWSALQIGREADRDPSWVRALMRGDNSRMFPDTEALFRALCERLVDEPGPSQRARRLAAERGWQPIEAWDETTIGDPGAEPYSWCRNDVDDVAIRLVLDGKRPVKSLRRPEKLALFRETADRSATSLARILRLSTTSIAEWRVKAEVNTTSDIKEAA